MTKRRIARAAAALLCAAALFLAACDQTEETPSGSEHPTQVPAAAAPDPTETDTVVLTDFSEQTVTVGPVHRIVSLTPSSTSILIEEGAQDRIVGVDSSSKGVEGAAVCGDYADPDVAEIVALQPDVVFCGNAVAQDAADEMRAAGLPVLNVEAVTFEQVPESFRLIGAVIGESAAAEALCEQLAANEEEVSRQKPDTSPSCLYVISFGDDGIWTSGPGSFINTMIDIAGGTCVTADGSAAWMELSDEELREADPDCIIYSSGAGEYDDIVASAEFSDLSAVENGLVFEIDEDVVSQPGPGLNEGLLALSSIIIEAAQGPVPSADPDATQTVLVD